MRVPLGSKLLDVATLRALSLGKHKIEICPQAQYNVHAGRAVVDNLVQKNEVAYGINTGFGLFANVVIPPDKLKILQTNLIRSHCAGVGTPLSREQSRMLLALRINTLAKGHSGVRMETLAKMVDAFNADCISVIPSQGTVGASGDLAPLSHLALGLMGEGYMWDPRDTTGSTTIQTATTTSTFATTGNKIAPAADVLKAHALEPIELEAKEGLALINGTQMMTAVGAEAIHQAKNAALCADITCALTVEVLKGLLQSAACNPTNVALATEHTQTNNVTYERINTKISLKTNLIAYMGTRRAFHSCIHAVRPHVGQGRVAARLRHLLSPSSELYKSHKHVGRVQDAYSLRCAPQVHGVVHDTITFAENIITTEMNSALDNPMVFTGSDEDEHGWFYDDDDDDDTTGVAKERPLDTFKKFSDTFYYGEGGFVISGGNFHGEYPAKALDYLAIGVQELANISERRLERLVNPSLSELPAFLVQEGGINSGFMIAHCTAAALTSENKVLCHPASVDTISTSGSKEDHVSMGGFSAHKAVRVVRNVEIVIAIELLAACQALDFYRPLTTTEPLERVYSLVRSVVDTWDQDRYMAGDIEAVTDLVRSGQVVKAAMPDGEDTGPLY